MNPFDICVCGHTRGYHEDVCICDECECNLFILGIKITKPPRKITENRDILPPIRRWLASQPDVKIFRNAQAFVQFDDGHKGRAGLGTGSADLIGSLTVQVPRYRLDGTRLPGQLITIARAMGIEVKRPGQKLRKEQVAWADAMHRAGWIVGVATSVEDVKDIIEKARRWEI